MKCKIVMFVSLFANILFLGIVLARVNCYQFGSWSDCEPQVLKESITRFHVDENTITFIKNIFARRHDARMEYSYYIDNNGEKVLHGTLCVWSAENNLVAEYPFSKGRLNGNCFEYHDNGKIKRISMRFDGARNGKGMTFNEQGVLVSECDFINGKLHGNCILYHKNGTIRGLLQFSMGKPSGYEYILSDGGVVTEFLPAPDDTNDAVDLNSMGFFGLKEDLSP